MVAIISKALLGASTFLCKSEYITTQPFRFLGLPSEIRLIIYSYVLIVGKIFYSPTPWEIRRRDRFTGLSTYEVPQVQLFRVCKLIHSEAEPVYLSKNLFVLPPQWPMYSPFRDRHDEMKYNRPRDRPLFSALGLQYVKNVNIAFTNASEGWTAIRTTLWDVAEAEAPNILVNMDGAARLVLFHATAMRHQSKNWMITVSALQHLEGGLQNLVMDFSDACCELGCHRVLFTEFEFLKTVQPERLRMVGLKGEEKELSMKAAAEKLEMEEEQLVKRYGFEINPEHDPWAEAKGARKMLKSRDEEGGKQIAGATTQTGEVGRGNRIYDNEDVTEYTTG